MCKAIVKEQLRRFLHSGRALALPVTYLILFVSLVVLVSVMYGFAVVKIAARGALLNASVARQNMQILDDATHSVAWSFGASEVVFMEDCGGVFQVQPTAKNLVLNFTDRQSFYDVLFSSSVGKAFYKLEPSEDDYASSFIRGDGRAIINQSSSTMTQLYIVTGEDAKELTLCFRPSTVAATVGTTNGKPSNLIRVYVLNLNSSQNLTLREEFYLKVTSFNVATAAHGYEFNQSVSSLALEANFDGTLSVVWLPISSSVEGAIVNLEVIVCNIIFRKVGV